MRVAVAQLVGDMKTVGVDVTPIGHFDTARPANVADAFKAVAAARISQCSRRRRHRQEVDLVFCGDDPVNVQGWAAKVAAVISRSSIPATSAVAGSRYLTRALSGAARKPCLRAQLPPPRGLPGDSTVSMPSISLRWFSANFVWTPGSDNWRRLTLGQGFLANQVATRTAVRASGPCLSSSSGPSMAHADSPTSTSTCSLRESPVNLAAFGPSPKNGISLLTEANTMAAGKVLAPMVLAPTATYSNDHPRGAGSHVAVHALAKA